MKKVFYKLLTNRYLWLIVFFLRNMIASAHDCSSPGDCEETAGYNAAVAIVGGAVALGVGLMGAGFTSTVPEGDDGLINENGEETEEEIAKNDREYVDKEEGDDKDFGDSDDDELSDEEIDELFDDGDDDDFFDDDDDDIIIEEDDDTSTDEDRFKEESKDQKENNVEGSDEKSKEKGFIDKTLGVLADLNVVRVLVDEVGVKKIWKSWDKAKEMAEATKSFYDKIKSLKAKGLTKLAGRYAEKLDWLLRKKASIRHGLKVTKLGRFMDKLGKMGDALDIVTSLKKVYDHKGDMLQKFGEASEETLRFIFKKWATKFPPVAIGDAILSLTTGNKYNLDKVVDKGIEGIKAVGGAAGTAAGNLSVKIENFLFGDGGASANKAFVDDLTYHKNRINNQKISLEEKKRRLKGVYRILRKRHNM